MLQREGRREGSTTNRNLLFLSKPRGGRWPGDREEATLFVFSSKVWVVQRKTRAMSAVSFCVTSRVGAVTGLNRPGIQFLVKDNDPC